MGGRGTFAAGNKTQYVYKTVGKIEGVKVLEGINGKHSLPEEAHSSWAYIKLKPNGTFHEMRIYDSDHYLTKEIAYHPEPKINKIKGNGNVSVLHIHDYKRDNFYDRPARVLTEAELKKYRKFLIGVKLK